MSQGFYGFPRILDIVRATTFTSLGKAGATNGAALAGGTASGAPTAPAGPFDVGDVIVDATGTLWIATVAGTSQSSPGTFVQVGTLVDPLTTRGDIIRRSASATQRLALGSANQVLQSDGTDVLWGAAPPGGGGALTQLGQTTLGSSAASIDFTSIPGSYSALRLGLVGQITAATTDATVWAQFNSDTAANYDFTQLSNDNATVSGATTTGASKVPVGDFPGTTGPANTPGVSEVTITGYAGTSWYKTAFALVSEKYSSTHFQIIVNSGLWKSTAAITTIHLFPNSGSFTANTVATLWGVS